MTQNSDGEAGMLSLRESLCEKIRQLISSLDIKHLDPMLFDTLKDEKVAHRDVL